MICAGFGGSGADLQVLLGIYQELTAQFGSAKGWAELYALQQAGRKIERHGL